MDKATQMNRRTAWMRAAEGNAEIRTTEPVLGASIHWVELIAIPTWLIWVLLTLEKVKIRSPAWMGVVFQSMATPNFD